MAKGGPGVSHKSYIGTRDFYPEDMEFRAWMFSRLRGVCETYGYREYGAPILEPVSLYEIKSSEEIVNEQLYRFVDRGEREVAIRPEMTPTLARLVAARIKQLPRPLRWFSIANFMRYERPGRGRLREFYQLNVDLIGSSGPAAEAEVFLIGMDLLRSFGAGDDTFILKFNDRRLFDGWFRDFPAGRLRAVGRLLDKKDKIGADEFESLLKTELQDAALVKDVFAYLDLTVDDLPAAVKNNRVEPVVAENIQELVGLLEVARGPDGTLPVAFAPGVVRGFDYYTGMLFEIYDQHPDNNRALFGGGRYDRLIGLFGKEDVPAVGFGMGDVTLENFITGHGLRPGLDTPQGAFLALFAGDLLAENLKLGSALRAAGIVVETALEATGKLGKQFELAEKKGRRLVLLQGADEIARGVVRVKDLVSGTQEDVERARLAERLRALLSVPGGRQSPGPEVTGVR